MYTSIQIPEKNISGSTWNVEASAVQKWNGEAVASGSSGPIQRPRQSHAYLAHGMNLGALLKLW